MGDTRGTQGGFMCYISCVMGTWDKCESTISSYLGFLHHTMGVPLHNMTLEMFGHGKHLMCWVFAQLDKGTTYGHMHQCLFQSILVIEWLHRCAPINHIHSQSILAMNLKKLRVFEKKYTSKKGKHPFKVEPRGVGHGVRQGGSDDRSDDVELPSVEELNSLASVWRESVVEMGVDDDSYFNFEFLSGAFHPSYTKLGQNDKPAFPQVEVDDDASPLPLKAQASLATNALLGRSVDVLARNALHALFTTSPMTLDVANKLRVATMGVLTWGYKSPTRLGALIDINVSSNSVEDPLTMLNTRDGNLVYYHGDHHIGLYTPHSKRSNVNISPTSHSKRVKVEVPLPHDSIPLSSLGGAVIDAYLKFGRPLILLGSTQEVRVETGATFLINLDGRGPLTPQQGRELWQKCFTMLEEDEYKGGIPYPTTCLPPLGVAFFHDYFMKSTSVELRHLYAFLVKLAFGDESRMLGYYAQAMDTSPEKLSSTYKYWPSPKWLEGMGAKWEKVLKQG